jgi:uncharacterized protein YndB with AHSA1/START domain
MKATFITLIALAFTGNPNSTKQAQNVMDPIIHINTLLNCPIDTAFAYFSENSKLEQWLTAKANVEMEVGGKYELFWTPEDPDLTNNSTYGCKVLAMDRPYFFNIEWKGNRDQKSFMNTVSPLTNVTVIFSEIDASKTKVTLLHTGWRSGSDWDAAREYFQNAWSGAIKQLEVLVNN